MPENPPLQRRTGFNRGEQSQLLLRTRHLGQPAIKAGPGDTVIFKNSPEIPGRGQQNIRTQLSNQMVAGFIFNRTGGAIDFDLILIDPDNKEFPFLLAGYGYPIPLADAQNLFMPSVGSLSAFAFPSGSGWPLIPLLPNWSLVLRITSGNPTAGKGVIVWPWASDMSNNFQAMMVPITTATVEIGPDAGRAWQLCGASLAGRNFSSGAPIYFNFDSVARNVEKEIYHLAGEDIQVNVAGPVNVTPRTTSDDGIAPGFQTEIGGKYKKGKGLVLAYPDKIKIKGLENPTNGPLYALLPFAEFDLPSDMHVEE